MKLLYFFSLLVAFSFLSYAQIVIKPLTYNSKISKNKLKNYILSDTLQLPFFDDFSYNSPFPDSTKWLNRFVYINKNFGKNPPSIGVATFDILNEKGNIYENASTTPFIADTLTSVPINLKFKKEFNMSFSISTTELHYYNSITQTYIGPQFLYYKYGNMILNCYYHPTTYNVTMNIYYGQDLQQNVSDSLYYYDTNTSQWVHIIRYIYTYYNVSDSLYFSFFAQPKGFGGNLPDNNDSLVLQFKNKNNQWLNVLSITKSNFTNIDTFKLFMIPIKDSMFIFEGFQFRFFNYGSTSALEFPSLVSNVDYWNIDYVYINAHRSHKDTLFPDVAFYNPVLTLLKPPYISVPWLHFKTDTTLELNKISFKYKNLGKDTFNVKRIIKVYKNNHSNVIRIDTLGNENIMPLELFEFTYTKPKYFIPDADTFAKFYVKYIINYTSSAFFQPYLSNDTLLLEQNFSDYYAYDDGSAEYGIGLAGNGTQNGKFAMLFVTNKPDTLRGVYMYFNKSYNNSNQKYFYLTIWTVNNGKPGEVLYSLIGQKPQFNGIDKYVYYSLDTAIFVKDSVFIGWIQTTQDFLNLGFDLNTNNSNNVYYNIGNGWFKNPYSGTPMIRAVFGPKKPNSVHSNMFNNISVYLNSSDGCLYINNIDRPIVFLYSLDGKLIKCNKSNILDIKNLKDGLYLLKIISEKNCYIYKMFIKSE
ncbi:MAG: hypothetical protein N3A01_00390 [Bacteroidales bacterium]|nr:hypothetical protein [Bacteroidales bacterium]